MSMRLRLRADSPDLRHENTLFVAAGGVRICPDRMIIMNIVIGVEVRAKVRTVDGGVGHGYGDLTLKNHRDVAEIGSSELCQEGFE